MTSQNKYLRRQYKRKLKKEKFYKTLGNYHTIFSYNNLYDSFSLCKQGVMWKASIQTYEMMKTDWTYKLYKALQNEIYRSMGFTEFNLIERGKLRHIRSVHISERCVQRTLCDNYIAPIVARNVIYDNGASMRNKGTSFALNRLQAHLHKYFNKNKTNQGYVLLYDFSDYFNSINHEKLYEIMDPLIKDSKIRKLFHHFIDCFGKRGLGLGSQVSQLGAIIFANKIDRMFKEKYHQKYYGRYMDDGYCFVRTKEEANFLKRELFKCCEEMDLRINEKKIQIKKLSSKFLFLKKYFCLTSSGHIIKNLCRKNIVTERRKLKKLGEQLKKGKIDYDQFRNSYQSWRQNALKYNNYWTVYNLDKIYKPLAWWGCQNIIFLI